MGVALFGLSNVPGLLPSDWLTSSSEELPVSHRPSNFVFSCSDWLTSLSEELPVSHWSSSVFLLRSDWLTSSSGELAVSHWSRNFISTFLLGLAHENVGLIARTNAFEVLFRVMLVMILSFLCWELREFLESATLLPWEDSILST